MTYDAALSQLKKLAVAGSQDLVPVTKALPLLSRSAIQRMIHGGKLPAIKINNVWSSTVRIAQTFWVDSLVASPSPKRTVFRTDDDLKAEHERARVAILGGA